MLEPLNLASSITRKKEKDEEETNPLFSHWYFGSLLALLTLVSTPTTKMLTAMASQVSVPRQPWGVFIVRV
jgi:hypothetical protein